MAKKLTDITTSYSTFAKDQILTETQLNEFLEYFDEQDRLSRICLSGVGIACGFELSTNSKTNAITISQGAGVTTDGDLIHLVAKERLKKKVNPENLKDILVDKITYEYYRKYESEEVEYHPHFNKNESAKEFDSIPLLEIVSNADKRPTDKNLQTLNLRNKIALFYLECYPKDPDTCVTVNCENQGIEQVNKLRVLLVDIAYINRITRPDNLFNSYITLESYLETKTVYVPRVILNEDNTSTAPALADEYQDTALINSAVSNIRSGVRTILQRLDRSPEAATFDVNMRRIFPINDPTNLILFQYKYDLLKDLADSYNELKELFLQNYATCCPNIAAFPKHLLLGSPYEARDSEDTFFSTPISEPVFVSELGSEEDNLLKRRIGPPPVIRDDRSYRHKFHKSPILLDSDEGNGRFESVLTRILTMVSEQGFYDSKEFQSETIRITPSNVRVPLGRKAVPFYYRFNNKLMLNWDFDKRGYDRHKSILGYRQASAYPYNPYVSNPLRFSLDPYDFYRIEGHQGHPYDQVFESLTELKNTFSLPFDIKVLGINVTEFDELLADQYKCDFKDLNVLLQAWSSEQECIATEVTYVLSSFSTKDPGANTVENDYFTIKGTRAVSVIPDLNLAADLSPTINDELTAPTASFRTTAFESPFVKTDSKTAAKETAYVNPVLSYINNEPDTVGFYLDKSIKDAGGNYANALAYATNTLGPIIKDWEDPVAVSTVNLPLQILVACTSLIELVPNSINQLTDSTLDSYNIEIAKLCSYTKQLQTQYRDPVLVGKVSEKTRSMVSLLVNQLTAICCSSKKLKALLEEVKKRKESIIKRLNFQDFALKNPGLEHKAGAGPGQTFVIVYLNDAITENTGGSSTGIGLFPGGINPIKPISPFTPITTINPAISPISSSFTSVEPSSEVKPSTNPELSSSELSAFASPTGSFDRSTRRAITGAGLTVNTNTIADLGIKDGFLIDPSLFLPSNEGKVIIPKGAVIADFTLPYLCCSDCAPISFVLPNIPVSLTLSDGTYCIDDTNKEIELTVTPNDGAVTIVDSVPGVDITDNKLSIDGSIFPDELLGSIIKFKVDGEDTDAELTVSKTPSIDFSVPAPGASRVVNFTVTGDDLPEFTYDWNFGDGNSSSEREPTHDYSDSGSRTNFIVTLTVQSVGGICPKVISHEVSFIDITVELENNTVCEDGAPIPFIVNPDGETVDVLGQGVNANSTHFDPTLVGPGTYPLTYDGNVFDVVTVNPKPVVRTKIIPKKVGVNLEFSIGTKFVTTYQWNFALPDGSKKTSKKEVPSISFDIIEKFQPGDEIKVSVKVSNGCGSETVDGVWIVPDTQDPTASLNDSVYCKEDKTVYDFTIGNFTPNTVISGDGVNAFATPPTFSPSGLDEGEHDILIDGKVAATVIIVEKPAMVIESVSPKVGGVVATTTIPSEVDVTSVLWTFEDANTGDELHASISAKNSVDVQLSDFEHEDWTEVRIILSAVAGPCGPVSDDKVFTKPLEVVVTVELPEYDFCEDDSKSYAFIFKPDNGSVTVTGQGVNTAESTFSPGALSPGSYILTASNGDTLSVTVHKKPSISIGTVVPKTEGFSTSTTLSAGVFLKSVIWTFEHPETGAVLHDPISGASSVSPIYKNFKDVVWTDVKITLTANSGPCGSISDSTIFTRPIEVDVTVELPKYIFCQDDRAQYDFTFKPDQPMKITGNGVNTAGTSFSPFNLTVGTHTLKAADGDTIIVTIVEPGVGTMNTPVHDLKNRKLTLSYTQIGTVKPEVQWNIGKKIIGDLPSSNDASYEVPLTFHGFEPGDTVLYQMILNSEVCGEKIDEGSFTIPVLSNPCETTMSTELAAIDGNAPTRSVILSIFTNSSKVNEIDVIYALLADMIQSPSAVVSGQLNDRIAADIGNFLRFVETEINFAMEIGDETRLALLLRLYRMAVAIYGTAFRCQDGFDFKDFTSGNKLNILLRKHFDNKDQNSLISKGIQVFDASNTGPFIALLNEKGNTEEPWATIDFIIKAKGVQR